MSVSEVLNSMRKQIKYTREQFSRELMVCFSTRNRWQNGRTEPSVLAKMRLLEYCKKNGIEEMIIMELSKY